MILTSVHRYVLKKYKHRDIEKENLQIEKNLTISTEYMNKNTEKISNLVYIRPSTFLTKDM